jgi:membrane protease YdiL (CAAX protease family)
VLLVGFALAGIIYDKRLSADKRAEHEAKAAQSGMLPQSGPEKAAFALFGLFAGFGWELLYRGFLLMVLVPVLGLPGAVILAALAYGIGHGYQDRAQFIGSIVASFLFTIAYALTGSLWWLMVLHAGMPMLALLQPRKPQAAPAT